MIAGIFHEGSGIGNQLHRYVATRVLATDKGYEWGMWYPNRSKVQSFMKLDTGKTPWAEFRIWNEKKVIENGVDIRSYDPEFNFIGDGTIIDGEFQDPRYFEHRMDDIDEWLTVEPMPILDDVCVIGFRGGEYSIFPDLYLPKEWWAEAISHFTPRVNFEVHTDDIKRATAMLSDLLPEGTQFICNAGFNWRSMRFARHAIIANSSFYILPRLLAHHGDDCITIAPRYWARHNTKTWALPQNYYKQFTYI